MYEKGSTNKCLLFLLLSFLFKIQASAHCRLSDRMLESYHKMLLQTIAHLQMVVGSIGDLKQLGSFEVLFILDIYRPHFLDLAYFI